MTIYYHVTTDLEHEGIFTPRVPNFRIKNEDYKTPRVCVAPSIEDCLTSMPDGSFGLREMLNNTKNKIKVFRIDTEKLGIHKRDIKSSVYLFKEGIVPDAATTNEHWITKEFSVPKEDSMVIEIDDWSEELRPIVPFHVFKLSQMSWAYKGDIDSCHKLFVGKGVQGVVAIKNLIYRKELVA